MIFVVSLFFGNSIPGPSCLTGPPRLTARHTAAPKQGKSETER